MKNRWVTSREVCKFTIFVMFIYNSHVKFNLTRSLYLHIYILIAVADFWDCSVSCLCVKMTTTVLHLAFKGRRGIVSG